MTVIDFTIPYSFQQLKHHGAAELIGSVKRFSNSGKMMSPDSLKAVVMLFTVFSRDLSLKQSERDEAADIATLLANAAIKTYGKQSTFCADMLASVESIMGRQVA